MKNLETLVVDCKEFLLPWEDTNEDEYDRFLNKTCYGTYCYVCEKYNKSKELYDSIQNSSKKSLYNFMKLKIREDILHSILSNKMELESFIARHLEELNEYLNS